MQIRSSLFVLGMLIALSCGVFIVASAAEESPKEYPLVGYETPHPQVTPTSTPQIVQFPLVPGIPQKPIPLSDAGCCISAAWSLDSEWVLFINAPEGSASAGLYGIPRAGGALTKITSRVGIYSEDWSMVAYPEGDQVYVERWIDGKRWGIPSSGRRVSFSPTNELMAWEIGSSSIQNQDVQVRKIWVSEIDGTGLRELVTIHGGSFQGWVDDGQAVLVSGRLTPTGPAGIWRIQISDGAGQLLFAVDTPRDLLISPQGTQIAFTIAFEADSDRNGLWVLPTSGTQPIKLQLYGAYRWRSEGELIVIPLDLDATGAYLTQLDVPSGAGWTLTTPLLSPLPIANNDWEISPDGRWMIFLSSENQGIHLFELPVVAGLP